MGQSININPVWLMFALFAFALLFGFVGLLLAVPLAAISGVLTRYALAKYQQSSLYLGPRREMAGWPKRRCRPRRLWPRGGAEGARRPRELTIHDTGLPGRRPAGARPGATSHRMQRPISSSAKATGWRTRMCWPSRTGPVR